MKKEENYKLSYEKTDYVIKSANDVNNDFINCNKIGISQEEREQIQKEFGKNYIPPKKFNHLKKFLSILIEPFNILLIFAGIVELLIFFLYKGGENRILTLSSALTVLLMVCLAGITDWVQDYKAYKSSIHLHKLVENKCLVFKERFDLKKVEDPTDIHKYVHQIDESELVVGDVIYLNAGDIVPSDCKVLWYDDLFLDESSLTGESELIEKSTNNSKTDMIELENILFSQSVIKKGSCLAVVINVGFDNYATSMLKDNDEDKNDSHFEKGIKKIVALLIAIIVIAVPIIFVITGLRDSKWIESLIFATSIAIGLIPESLPAIISSNLQIGSKRLSKEKIVVKNLDVVQNLGGVNILCTDKTGTLTVDEITLDDYMNFDGQKTDQLKELLYINSFYQKNISNKMDYAIRERIKEDNWDDEGKFEFVDDIPFDFSTRIASVLVKQKSKYFQITKGSIEEVMKKVSFLRTKNKVIKMTDEHYNQIDNMIKEYSSKGFRTIAIVTKETKKFEENDFVFEGIALFSEILKEGTKEIIKKIYNQNIEIKVLTGDAREITHNIAQKLEMQNISSISGKEIELLNDGNNEDKICENSLFVKLSPYDKAEIVNHFKSEEKTIAFMGDGINDAMVIKNADVGISVNNGTPLAKAAASIILLEKNLNVLDNAFMKGREIFSNAIKFVKLTIASNMGLLFTLFISSIWLNFEIATPLQLIIQNLIFDFANLFFVFDKIEEHTIRKPVVWNTKTFLPFGVLNGLALTATSMINICIMGFAMNMFNEIKNGNDVALDQFQTSFFIECVISHIIFIMVMRSDRTIFFKAFPNLILFTSLLCFAVIAIIVVVVLSFIGGVDFALPNANIAYSLLGMIPTTIILQEIFKNSYKLIFKSWM